MSWLDQVQVRDFEDGDRFELRCRKCGSIRLLSIKEIRTRGDFNHLWLSEVEARSCCRQRGCGGKVRLSHPHGAEVKGFVGGIA